jgi:hypothetical protein
MEVEPMQHVERDGARKETAPRARKEPYVTPTLTVHGGVEEITEVLRLSCIKGTVSSRTDIFI